MEPEKLDLRSHTIAEDKKAELLRLLPEIRTEGGKIDFDRLRLALGETVDVGKERYGMTWPGKADCFKTIQSPSMGTLRPCPEESVNFDTTENLIIEGDNLEVLKLLQKSYMGKVKMIYIDPPYNTGNDFIYPDNYTESLQTYLEYTGQVDAQGKRFGTNTDTDGRFHSKWMNMMYPRLYLARNLLKDEGIIFVSIDDNESSNLRKICDDIFGETNYIGNITWEKRTKSQNTETARDQFQSKTENVFVYTKQGEKVSFNLMIAGKKQYTLKDDKGIYREKLVEEMSALGMRGRSSMIYPILGINPRKGKQWQIGVQETNKFVERGDVYVRDGKVYLKMRPKDENETKYLPFWSHFFDKEAYGTAETGKAELTEILGTNAHGFETVKPMALIKKLIFHVKEKFAIGSEPAEIVLDFFAGSGTTGHAVLDLNKQDNGNRRFILVQLPEPCDRESAAFKAGYKTIADITKERVRRVIKKMNKEDEGKLGLDGKKQDRGFKVFKLSESNFKTWESANPQGDPAKLTKQMELHINHVRENRTQDDILFEILLKSGFPLTTPIEKLPSAGKTIHSAAGGGLLICLERQMTLELIRAMADKKPERVVCLDEGFAGNDQLKANAVQTFKDRNVVFRTV